MEKEYEYSIIEDKIGSVINLYLFTTFGETMNRLQNIFFVNDVVYADGMEGWYDKSYVILTEKSLNQFQEGYTNELSIMLNDSYNLTVYRLQK